jgi:succinate-semialdehyde dehydrogenase / glutarate-semialdehyde dehydrogenase
MTTTAADEAKVLADVPTQLLIGGTWQDATGGRRFEVRDPSTGSSLVAVADATPEDAVRALDAAVAAQDEWAATAPRKRGEILRRSWELVQQRKDDIALLMTLEMGKPIAESLGEVT